MSCETKQDAILLEQSGELSLPGRILLRLHLRTCDACRAFRADAAKLAAMKDPATVPDTPAPSMQAILSFAKKEGSRSVEIRFRPARRPLFEQLRPAFVYSAISLLLLLAFLAVVGPSRTRDQGAPAVAQNGKEALDWDNGIDAEISRVDDLLEMANSDTSSTDTSDLDSIAKELLALEGINI